MSPVISIIKYTDSYQPVFRALNLEWLDHYNLREPADMEVLDDPKTMVIDKGGHIWLAIADGKIIGSAALIKEGDTTYELAKMAVTEEWRGKGISRLLIDTCLIKARAIGATKLTLYSNHQLKTAISLYEKYGFRHIAVHDSPFATADIMMELAL